MKTRFLFLILPLLLLQSIATGQAEKTFVKSFNLMGRQSVVLNLGNNVQVSSWDNDVVRVQMTVAAHTTEATLKALAESGRYILKSDYTEHDFTISAPNLSKTVKLNGVELKEQISFLIFLPKNVTYLKQTDIQPKTAITINP